jgi:ABC-type uncharacterized transport system involved in gliding motility auxiliary subunit
MSSRSIRLPSTGRSSMEALTLAAVVIVPLIVLVYVVLEG